MKKIDQGVRTFIVCIKQNVKILFQSVLHIQFLYLRMNTDTITVLQILKLNNKAVMTVIIAMLIAIFQFPAIVIYIPFSGSVKYQINKCTITMINKKSVTTILSSVRSGSTSSSKFKELLQWLHYVPKFLGSLIVTFTIISDAFMFVCMYICVYS